jgi:hypothetical protein
VGDQRFKSGNVPVKDICNRSKFAHKCVTKLYEGKSRSKGTFLISRSVRWLTLLVLIPLVWCSVV